MVTPEWLTVARVILYLLAFCFFVSPFLMERYIRSKSAEKILKQGIDPEISILIYGLTLFLVPTCIAFFFQFFSAGSPTDVYICSGMSSLGIIFWAWHQRAVLKINGKSGLEKSSPETIQSKAPFINSAKDSINRLYTIILILLGIISLALFVLRILLLFWPPDCYTFPSSLGIHWIPIHGFMAISEILK